MNTNVEPVARYRIFRSCPLFPKSVGCPSIYLFNICAFQLGFAILFRIKSNDYHLHCHEMDKGDDLMSVYTPSDAQEYR